MVTICKNNRNLEEMKIFISTGAKFAEENGLSKIE